MIETNQNLVTHLLDLNLGAKRASEHYRWEDGSMSDHVPESPFGSGAVVPISDMSIMTAAILNADFGESKSEASILGGYEENGDDWLACYKSFQKYGSDWGIYFRLEKMASFTELKCRNIGIDSRLRYRQALVEKVKRHEDFHFHVEYKCAHLPQPRSIANKPAEFRNDAYEGLQLAKEKSNGVIWLEEAMANAYALTRDIKSAEIRDFLCRICDNAPPGYRDYAKCCILGGRVPSKTVFASSLACYGRHLYEPSRLDLQTFQITQSRNASVFERYHLASAKLRKPIPLYLILEEKQVSESALELKIANMRLSEFYKGLEKLGVRVLNGKKHMKLEFEKDGRLRKMNGWQRPETNTEADMYMVRQVAAWLGIKKQSVLKHLRK